MTIIEQIKAEVERLYDGEAPKHDQQCDFDDGYFTGIGAISQFIDTLESEKSVPKDLEEAAKEKYPFATTPPHDAKASGWYNAAQVELQKAFIFGAKWQKEHMMKKDYPKWRRIKAGERLPCPAYVWPIAYDNYPDCFEGRLVPNIQGVKVGRDTWYLPVDVIHNLPKEGEK